MTYDVFDSYFLIVKERFRNYWKLVHMTSHLSHDTIFPAEGAFATFLGGIHYIYKSFYSGPFSVVYQGQSYH